MKGPPPAPAPQKNYYVVYVSHLDASLVGIHCTQWITLLERIPGGKLSGSGVRTAKKFHTEPEAIEYFYANAAVSATCPIYHY